MTVGTIKTTFRQLKAFIFLETNAISDFKSSLKVTNIMILPGPRNYIFLLILDHVSTN